MKTMLAILASLSTASAGGLLWSPWASSGGEPTSKVATQHAAPLTEDEPSNITLVLIGAAVVCFVAARRVG